MGDQIFYILWVATFYKAKSDNFIIRDKNI